MSSLSASAASRWREAWSIPEQRILETLEADPSTGLSREEAASRLVEFGPNRLEAPRRRSLWRLLIDQFRNLIAALLIVAAIVAVVLGDWLEGAAVGLVLLVNAGLGFVIEWRAVRSMEALRRLVVPRARVRRSGELIEVPAESLVPGDLVVVEAGDIITADLRVLAGAELQVDESTLTGESEPVSKSPGLLAGATMMADRTNLLHSGSRVTRGTGTGVVVATGRASELGQVAEMVARAEANEAADETPMERRLARLGVRLLWLTLGVAVATFGAGILTGKEVGLMLKTAIALAVAAIPEGLPVVATIALARGLWRMAERNALINRLTAVETLGATGVICTDKTGTLTENRMTLVRAMLPGSLEIDVDSGPLGPFGPDTPAAVLFRFGILCNNAETAEGVGDPLEVALLAAGEKAGIDIASTREEYSRVREIPFESERRLMATYHRCGEEGVLVAVKGGPEAVLDACDLDAGDRLNWLRENERLAAAGLRVLALASKRGSTEEERPFEGLTFAGLVGLKDPPRADVPAALQECRKAGIRVVMVTGDQPHTAQAIAREIGLVGEEDEDQAEVIRGSEFEALDPDRREDDRRRLLEGRIFARVTPAQKLRLVQLHQQSGQVVAMTGDGVNDAPALTQADIGIAMGKRGTEVAREAGDMVLRDDAFPSIVVAVAQGRVIFANLRKFVTYLLACNFSEILVVGLATLFSRDLPILPLQILFLNLVTDVFPALALGVGQSEGNLMERAPRPAGEPVMRSRDWRRVFLHGVVLAAATLGAYFWAVEGAGQAPGEAITVSFLTLALAQLVQVFNHAHGDVPYFRSEVVRNPFVWAALAFCGFLLWLATHVSPVAGVLGLHAPSGKEWLAIAGFGLVPLVWGLANRALSGLLPRQ